MSIQVQPQAPAMVSTCAFCNRKHCFFTFETDMCPQCDELADLESRIEETGEYTLLDAVKAHDLVQTIKSLGGKPEFAYV